MAWSSAQARIASASVIHYMLCPLLGLLYQHLVLPEELTWTSFAGSNRGFFAQFLLLVQQGEKIVKSTVFFLNFPVFCWYPHFYWWFLWWNHHIFQIKCLGSLPGYGFVSMAIAPWTWTSESNGSPMREVTDGVFWRSFTGNNSDIIMCLKQCHKPPMTGNGKFISPIKMVMTGGWLMTLF